MTLQETERRRRQSKRDREAEQARRDRHLHDEAILRPDPDTLHPLTSYVPRLVAERILGFGYNKLYRLLREGVLVAVKDNQRTLITIESIKRYQASLPRATFGPPAPPRQHTFPVRKKKSRRFKGRA